MARVLVTGGAGFVGSHTCVSLLNAGHDLCVYDSFANSSLISLERVLSITNIDKSEKQKKLSVVKGDIRDRDSLRQVFKDSLDQKREITAVIHFAGLKSVCDSVKDPLIYWDVNVSGTRNILALMEEFRCKTFIFSSSATIYGVPKTIPIPETSLINPINPYGNTKVAVERMLEDLGNKDSWRIASLRYFNPVGAHQSGLIGEDPVGIPNNLFPFVSQVASGERDILKIFGDDWPTKDGTCIRDYIHIMDLAEGHLAAFNYLEKRSPQYINLNLGSGVGHSVFEVIDAFEKTIGKSIKYKIAERRDGDVPITIANASRAEELLKWKAKRNLIEMCKDSWNWQSKNPTGYKLEVI